MFVTRDGHTPRAAPTARIAPSAQIIGNVEIGERCYVDYGVVIASSGAPIRLHDDVIVLANSVVRSVGGSHRPPFPVEIGPRSLISPLSALVGCRVGARCYLATGVLVFQGAEIGDGSRIAAGAIVHVRTVLPPGTHVGLRHIAVAAASAAGFIATPDVAEARAHLAATDFFRSVFDEDAADQEHLHERVMETLARELFESADILPAT
jgi:carbonic anhydrase/acetyltransferase-like protein (isoleucine patch superfamily)